MTNKIQSTHVLLADLDEENISSLLKTWGEVSKVKKELEEIQEALKTKIKVFLKERHWTRFVDKDTKLSVSISSLKREIIDKEQLKMILDESQMAQITRTTTYERVQIVTPETRQRLKNVVRKKER